MLAMTLDLALLWISWHVPTSSDVVIGLTVISYMLPIVLFIPFCALRKVLLKHQIYLPILVLCLGIMASIVLSLPSFGLSSWWLRKLGWFTIGNFAIGSLLLPVASIAMLNCFERISVSSASSRKWLSFIAFVCCFILYWNHYLWTLSNGEIISLFMGIPIWNLVVIIISIGILICLFCLGSSKASIHSAIVFSIFNYLSIPILLLRLQLGKTGLLDKIEGLSLLNAILFALLYSSISSAVIIATSIVLTIKNSAINISDQ